MKILYITPFVPYRDIPHAGGYFLYRYLVGLLPHISIHILAPRTPENEHAANMLHAEYRNKFTVTLAGEIENKKHSWQKIVPVLWNCILKPLATNYSQLNQVSAYLENSDILKFVDIVELQFTQMLPLVRVIKKERAELPVTCFEHDVFFQSVQRRVQGASLSKNKIMNMLRLFRVKTDEVKFLNQCNAVFVFSEKDKKLLQEIGTMTSIDTFIASIDIPNEPSSLLGDPRCLFVGAMERPENHEGISWFLAKVWPGVLKHIPEAKLQIVGANPPEHIKNNSHQNVTVTGFVDQINPYYEQATLCVAPLLTGAGVKFKVLQAMAYGLPVVTTPVGAEGIAEQESESIFPYNTFDPEMLIEGIVTYLTDRNLLFKQSKLMRKWMEENYSFEALTISRAIKNYKNMKNQNNGLRENNNIRVLN